jgi:hypothetical protein
VSLLAIKGAIDDVTGVGQRRRQLTVKIRIVFNNKQAQAGLRIWLLSISDIRHPEEPGWRERPVNSAG